jgi:hypothetical protein
MRNKERKITQPFQKKKSKILICLTKSSNSLTNKAKQNKNARSIKSINRKVYLRDYDENLDEVIDQQDKQVYEHTDKPLVLELYPKKKKQKHFIYSFRIESNNLLANYNKDDI